MSPVQTLLETSGTSPEAFAHTSPELHAVREELSRIHSLRDRPNTHPDN